jgi:ABC-type glycerol-3-phosphate transport system permease component
MVRQNPTPEIDAGSRKRWQRFFHELPSKSAVYLLLSLWASVSIFAFLWVLSTSLKTNQELYSIKSIWGFPAVPQWINYVNAWVRSKMGYFFLNSIIVTVFSVLLTNLLASMAGYILGRFKFRGSQPILISFIAGTAIPIEMIMIPVWVDHGLYGNLVAFHHFSANRLLSLFATRTGGSCYPGWSFRIRCVLEGDGTTGNARYHHRDDI